jgi:hypothetical protein
MRRSSEYQVGYGRPPQNTRFPKGQSAIPKAARKGHEAWRASGDLEAKMHHLGSALMGTGP